MKRTALVLGLPVLVVLLAGTVFYWTGYHEVTSPGRTLYRVNRVTGEVTTVRMQEIDRRHVLDRSPVSKSMAPRHILPSPAEQIR
ncbi:MAG: hypothetical protein H6Q55_3909 [Deltaproteobacteria bacterium]|nr:hypothetical protein [Deltaproteobacteria bacterium]